MRIKIDENLPIEVAELFKQAGHDAITVMEQGLGGEADDEIASICKDEQRILVTLDVDFADIRHYPPKEYEGIIVLRLIHQDKSHIVDIIRRLMVVVSPEPIEHRLWIVEEDHIRIRD
jgi:predicted nuclease of predicted toxin-antitoxin system